MLLEFQVENYLSFKENTILSMIASSSKKELSDSIIVKDRYKILSSIAIYGANASGKSNFLRAIQFMKKIIFDSARESQVGDEIDARLHPGLCNVLISLFNSKESNKNNAQIVFATHNTQIMNRRMLRRDQIYFVEKDKYGESELYSLLDYKKVRNDASYDKDYLLGKYGAVPYIGNFETFVAGDE